MAIKGVARRLLRQPRVGLLLMPLLMNVARPAAAQADNKAAARAHFEKGVADFNDRRFAEAADEFETAYRLSPAFVVLYNLGEVDVALGKSVEAVDAFDQYLKQGASAISAQRRREVLDEIEKQRARIGTISVRTLPDGASIRIDGALVGKTPLASALRVTAGHHTVEAVLADHAPETREISVGGQSNEHLELTLTPVVAPPAAAPAPPTSPAEHSIIEEHVVVENQAAAPAPAIEKPAAPQPEAAAVARSSTNWQRIIGVIITVGGVATATVGGINAYQGINQANDAKDRLGMEGGSAYDADKIIFDAAKSRSERGWITAGVGGGILLVGVIVIATAPDKSSSIALAPWAVAGNGGLAMSGAW